jgi:membrane-associated phospholipid phosphatase
MLRLNRVQRIWVWIIASLFLLFISTWLANQNKLITGESMLLEIIYGWPDGFRGIFILLTMLGSPWILAVILILAFTYRRIDVGLRMLWVGGLALLVSAMTKLFVARPRPGLLGDIIHRETLVQGFGFPSGHTALAVSLAIILAVYLPKQLRYVSVLWVFVVALSRLYLGVHAPLDIIGGLSIGILAALSVLMVLPVHKNSQKINIVKKRKQR